MRCLHFGDRFFIERLNQRARRSLHDCGFKLLFVQSKDLIDLEFDLLPFLEKATLQLFEHRKMKENVVAKVFGFDEAKFAIINNFDDMSDSHG